MVTDDALVSDFEAAAKQSWQSFSTMKRFVCEANRLENASWRLWFMQKDQNNRIRKSKSTGSLAAIDAQAQHQSPHQPPRGMNGKKASYDSRASSSTSTLDADDVSLPLCVYCEMHAAHLSCNGCCHDVYCVSCFKLVHKKGTLATHTAVKIKELLLRRSMEQMMEVSEAESAMSVSSEGQPDVEPSEAPLSGSKSPTHHTGGAAPLRSSSSGKTKPWEIQMDMLIQRLMMNSMHTDGDISVHNIDNRDSLGTAESVASFLSDIAMDDNDGAPVPLKTVSTTAPTDWSDANEKSNQAVVAAAVLVAGRHQKRTLSFDGMLSQPQTQAPGPANSTLTHSAASPSPVSMTKTASERTVPDLPLFPVPPSLPRTKSKKKNSVCQNCSGNHITIDCPLLASSGMGSGPAASSSSAMGVDTVLRKCFTTIHNDNLSNSTHAFLGDEISVRGGGHFAKSQFASSANASASLRDSSAWSSFGMNSISEDHSAESEDTLPVLLPLHASLAPESDARKWDCTTWLISSLATELPQGAYEAVRTTEKTCADPLAHMHAEAQRHALASWVFVKEPGRKWCKRYLSLYRNSLWEFLDDKDTSRPVGYANVSEGSVHEHQGTTLEFALKYYRQSSPLSARNECWLQFESDAEATKWREQLMIATRLQVDDLFDLAPDSGKNDTPESYELGKGRFSVVRRACRKHSSASASSSASAAPALNCALKIIDKNVFWDLVAHETEREDTVVREILTQSLLTVRSGALYCPVIRLLSLFETRNLLVLELELMQEGDLHEEIVTNSAIDEVRAPFLVASLVKAIDYCLQNGVAHRDVKLSNLALDFVTCPKGKRYSVIKMADFGMAAFIQSDGRLKGRCGTPGFVAPEILTAGKGESYPSGVDMFSVGVVTYTMLCGYEPFFGVNDDELIQMNKSVEYEFEEPEWATISDEAKDLITLMMEKDTTKRITPQEALAHPFLRDASAQLDEILRAEAPLCEIRLL